jgi:hypothetical protein
MLPACTALALIAAIGVGKLLSQISYQPAAAGLLAAVLILLAIMLYDPRPMLPTAAAREAGHEFLAMIKAENGKGWIPFHGYYSSIAGYDVAANESSIMSVVAGDNRWGSQLLREIDSAIIQQQFDWIVMNSRWLEPALLKHYHRELLPAEITEEFKPVAGWRTSPKFIYRKIREKE